MKAREYLEAMKTAFRPRTPNAALRAAEMGYVSVDVYSRTAASVAPLHAGNITVDELDRILGQPNRNLETNLFLSAILDRLLDHPDAEMALFAAESLSLVEYGYTSRIEELKEELSETYDIDTLRETARLYYELALLNQGKGAIKRFYLREAFSIMRTVEKLEDYSLEDVKLRVRLVMSLGLFSQAREILSRYSDDPEMKFLEAEAEFAAGNFARIFEICREAGRTPHLLTTEDRKILDFWLTHGI